MVKYNKIYAAEFNNHGNSIVNNCSLDRFSASLTFKSKWVGETDYSASRAV